MSASTSPKPLSGQRSFLMATDTSKPEALLEICRLARRAPDKFVRRGTRWLTVYEFFVCDQNLLEMDAITMYDAEAFAIRNPWRVDQIYNGLKSPSEEPIE